MHSGIKEIEKVSNAEIVLVISDKSDDYSEIPYVFALILMLFAFTFFMFSKAVFGDYLFYFGTIFAGILGFAMGLVFNKVGRIIIGKSRMQKNVEAKGRAIFQKAKIYETKKRTGILIYLSEFEKLSFIIADTGVENLFPENILQKIQLDFNLILKSKITEDIIYDTLLKYKTDFEKYLPKSQDDTNELSDNFKIDF